MTMHVINGPGTADMKGGVAVMLAALKAIEASEAASDHRLRRHHQQRRGSRLARLGGADRGGGPRKDERRSTYEPSALPDGTLAGARPGSGNFAIAIHGRSAHAGRNPDDGRNAVARRGGPRLAVRERCGKPGLP